MTIFDQPRPQDKLAILKRIALFASCTDAQLQLVAERTRLVEYKKGECVYREGDVANALYIVASGRLQVYTTVDGSKELYTVLHNGDTFGEISLLTGETHSATVEALNDTLVLQLAKRDFDDLINRIPSLVLHLSRLLSKRLRSKGHASRSAEASVVAIYSAARGVGRTLFAMALGAALRRETRRSVIMVDLSTPPGQAHRFIPGAHPALAGSAVHGGLLSEESLAHDIQPHPMGFDVLCVGASSDAEEHESLIAPLISGLTQRYSYILLDLPVEVDATVLKALTQADLIYLVSGCSKEAVIRTRALRRQLHDAMASREEHIKLVLNLMACGEDRLTPAEVAESFGQPANFLLPHVEAFAGDPASPDLLRELERSDSPYVVTVRRMARELGGLLVGLALGSGAALGLAHIGVLKVIEREKIPIDLVAGSSIGAMVGGLWACGKSVKELEEMALRFKNPWDIRRLFMLDLGLPAASLVIGLLAGAVMGALAGFLAGLFFGFIVCVVLALIMGPLVGGPIQGAQLMERLRADFEGKTFEQTRIPLKVIACNPNAREEVVFESGPLAEAVRASVSIPGIFKPAVHQGKLCVDGGAINPVPVSVLRRAGANRVIAVNVFPTTAELAAHLEKVRRQRAEAEEQLQSRSFLVRLWAWVQQELRLSVSPLVFDVIMRAMQSMEYQISEIGCRDADVIVRPTVPGSHWLEFYDPEKFIQRGEEEALRLLPLLKRVAGVSEGAQEAEPTLTTLRSTGTITN